MLIKQHITVAQAKELPEAVQQQLAEWLKYNVGDGDLVHVFIPQEELGEYDGEFLGTWDQEFEFDYPDERTGKLKNHEGTIIPLMDIGQMLQFLADRDAMPITLPFSPAELCDELWSQCKDELERIEN